MTDPKNEANRHMANLRQMASIANIWDGTDPDELKAAADFIEHQQAKIDELEASLNSIENDAFGREK